MILQGVNKFVNRLSENNFFKFSSTLSNKKIGLIAVIIFGLFSTYCFFRYSSGRKLQGASVQGKNADSSDSNTTQVRIKNVGGAQDLTINTNRNLHEITKQESDVIKKDDPIISSESEGEKTSSSDEVSDSIKEKNPSIIPSEPEGEKASSSDEVSDIIKEESLSIPSEPKDKPLTPEELYQKALKCTDPKEAFHLFKAAAEQDHLDAIFHLSACFKRGKGIDQDYSQAFAWCRKAAEKGHAGACFGLADCYKQGMGTTEDPNQAFIWCKKAAEAGSLRAIYCLGISYETGYGISETIGAAEAYQQAYECYLKAANQGYIEAQYRLAKFCNNDYPTRKRTPKESLEWYQKAASKNHVKAQYELGLLYKLGKHGFKTEAFKWFKKAADAGNDEAQYQVALFFEKGIDGNKNLVEARNYYTKSAAAGNEDAEAWLSKNSA